MYNILLYCFIIFSMHYVNANRILSREEVLKIKNEYYISYYCKNDKCVETNYDYRDYFIEIPDDNGNLIKYITRACTYNDIKLEKCISTEKCITDSQCLSNRCIDNYCAFNDKTPVVHCDSIYVPPSLLKSRSSYMYCGKAYLDTCENNDECSSKKCIEGYCNKQKDGPHE
ncbi:hypothetical protein PIROE2DRAFT_65176, partial [Piromyces sp. E2]